MRNKKIIYVEPIREDDDIKVRIIVDNSYTVMLHEERKRFSIYSVDSLIRKYILVVVHLEDRRNSDSDDRIATIK